MKKFLLYGILYPLVALPVMAALNSDMFGMEISRDAMIATLVLFCLLGMLVATAWSLIITVFTIVLLVAAAMKYFLSYTPESPYLVIMAVIAAILVCAHEYAAAVRYSRATQ